MFLFNRKKIVLKIFLILLFLSIAIVWFFNGKIYPIEYGTSFDSEYAEYLGLDWKQTYSSMIKDFNLKFLRISAYWDDIEPRKNHYFFEDLDWMMKEAEKNGVKIVLVVGQKAPRWPECHIPLWFKILENKEEQKKELLKYVEKIVERYKNSEALEIWQVENEPFISFEFGECLNYTNEWVADEISIIKNSDKEHKIMITDSGELGKWRKAVEMSDIFGTTLYRTVVHPGGKIFKYDYLLSPIFYRAKAKISGVKFEEVFISELQAEPWFSAGFGPKDIEIEKQFLNTPPERIKENMEFARRTGFKRAYLWGAEWWYFMKQNGKGEYVEIVKMMIETH